MKPLIAKDTREPLVVLGGYEIVQGGGIRRNPIDLSKPGGPNPPTQDDLDLLEKFGEEGLRERQFFGSIERLENAGIIKKGAKE